MLIVLGPKRKVAQEEVSSRSLRIPVGAGPVLLPPALHLAPPAPHAGARGSRSSGDALGQAPARGWPGRVDRGRQPPGSCPGLGGTRRNPPATALGAGAALPGRLRPGARRA